MVQAQTLLAQETHFNEWKKQFGLFLDHKDIWRCGCRSDNADLQYTAKHSIFVSKHHKKSDFSVKVNFIKVNFVFPNHFIIII